MIQDAILTHLTPAAGSLGLVTLKTYAGQLEDLEQKPATSLDAMPAAYLVPVEEVLYGIETEGHFEGAFIVAVRSQAQDKDAAGQSAYNLGRDLVHWLAANHAWTASGAGYQFDLERGLQLSVRTIKTSYSLAVVLFSLIYTASGG
jgi:hypothetical protein